MSRALTPRVEKPVSIAPALPKAHSVSLKSTRWHSSPGLWRSKPAEGAKGELIRESGDQVNCPSPLLLGVSFLWGQCRAAGSGLSQWRAGAELFNSRL